VQFAKPSTTRFVLYFDVLDRCGRNKSVCQAMVNDDEAFDGVSPARTADARQKNDKFCELVQSSAFWKNSKAPRDLLELLVTFLRKWDSPTARLPDVFPAVVVVEDALRELRPRNKPGLSSSVSRQRLSTTYPSLPPPACTDLSIVEFESRISNRFVTSPPC
jgi:hypothetical protein